MQNQNHSQNLGLTPKVPVTIKYRSRRADLPVYIAGTFSDPAWAMQEMRHEQHSGDASTFATDINVVPGQDYQFKMRLGKEGEWVLDGQSPTTTDGVGNVNNLLKIPHSVEPGTCWVYGTPSAKPRQMKRPSRVRVTSPEDTEFDVVANSPLFAHECLGAIDVFDVDDISDEPRSEESERNMPSRKPHLVCENTMEADLQDPTIEIFPLDKYSVLSELCKIQSSTSDDGVFSDDMSNHSYNGSRRQSIESNDDHLSSSAGPPTPLKKRDSRLSHSRNRSAISLSSIAEEQKVDGHGARATFHSSHSVSLCSEADEADWAKPIKATTLRASPGSPVSPLHRHGL